MDENKVLSMKGRKYIALSVFSFLLKNHIVYAYSKKIFQTVEMSVHRKVIFPTPQSPSQEFWVIILEMFSPYIA